MSKEKLNFSEIIGTAGAFIAFMIGSGFATGQETLQYFVSYGIWGFCGMLVCLILLLYVSISFVKAGIKERFVHANEIYHYYCGKFFGTIFDYFTVISIYLCYVVMLSGAGAAMNQYFGVPVMVGAIAMGLLSCITVMFGLKRMVDIIGKIGPVIIVLVMLLGLSAIANGDISQIGAISHKINNTEMLRASTNWFMSALSYVGISIVWLATFMTALGAASQNPKSVTIGSAAGVVVFILGMFVLATGLMLNIDSVAGTEIPSLILASNISAALGMVFTVIVVAGIYTTAVPLLWTVVNHLADDGTKRFRLSTCLLAAVGTFIALFISFSSLVNVVYVLIGYLGFILIAFMAAKQLKGLKKN